MMVRFNYKLGDDSKRLGGALIYLHMSIRGEPPVKYNTGQRVKVTEWDPERELVKGSGERVNYVNYYLATLRRSFEGVELDLTRRGMQPTLYDIERYLAGLKVKKTDTFVPWANKIINGMSIDIDTANQLRRVIYLAELCRPGLDFADIDTAFLTDFMKFLQDQSLAPSSIKKYFDKLDQIIGIAVKKKLVRMEMNPFNSFPSPKIPKEEAIHLTEEEVQILADLELSGEMKVLRDMFLLGVYTGLRRMDIILLEQRHISVKQGNWILEKIMNKGEKRYKKKIRLNISVLFNGKAVDILKQHMNPERKYIFGIEYNKLIDQRLKELPALAGIDKKFTFHTSRHTCGYIIAKRTKSPLAVKEILHHSSLQMSMRYTHLLDSDVDDIIKNAFK